MQSDGQLGTLGVAMESSRLRAGLLPTVLRHLCPQSSPAAAAAAPTERSLRCASPLTPRFQFGEAEQTRFEREGYCVFEQFLSEPMVREGREHIDRMLAERAQGFSGMECMSPHQLGGDPAAPTSHPARSTLAGSALPPAR